MGKNTIKRKQLRRKFKRRAAALAGAAMITGAALSGIPVTKALAAEAPLNQPPTKTEQAIQVTKTARPPGKGWHQHKNSWPGTNENQAWYQDGKIYYRSDNQQYRDEYAYQFDNPVDYVKDRASAFGFNSARATFTLLTVSTENALVEITQHDTGKLYNVLLKRTYDHGWTIVEVRAL